ESIRLRAAGKAASRKLGCYARAASKGVRVDSAPGGCLDRAHAKFVKAFDAVTGCTGDGQADAVEAVISAQCVGQPADSDDDGNVSGLCPAISPACGNGAADNDSDATSEANRAVIIHPSVNLAEATRYIVALRRMKDSSDTLIAPTADFLAYRDGTPTGDSLKEARRPHMEAIFTTLAAAGV